MSNLEAYQAEMRRAFMMRLEAERLLRQASGIEMVAERDFGLECVSRDPGFPCWTITGIGGFFNTPEEALRFKDAKEQA